MQFRCLAARLVKCSLAPTTLLLAAIFFGPSPATAADDSVAQVKSFIANHKVFLKNVKEYREALSGGVKGAAPRTESTRTLDAQVAQLQLLADNAFDLVFLYHDHFLARVKSDKIVAAYFATRLQGLAENMAALVASLRDEQGGAPPVSGRVSIASLLQDASNYAGWITFLSEAIMKNRPD